MIKKDYFIKDVQQTINNNPIKYMTSNMNKHHFIKYKDDFDLLWNQLPMVVTLNKIIKISLIFTLEIFSNSKVIICYYISVFIYTLICSQLPYASCISFTLVKDITAKQTRQLLRTTNSTDLTIKIKLEF